MADYHPSDAVRDARRHYVEALEQTLWNVIEVNVKVYRLQGQERIREKLYDFVDFELVP
jgi:hypothetical protein